MPRWYASKLFQREQFLRAFYAYHFLREDRPGNDPATCFTLVPVALSASHG